MANAIEPNLGELSTETDGGVLQARAAAYAGPVPVAVDRYRVEGLLGAGGMGVVFSAYDPELARSVALKLISPGATGEDSIGRATRRLLREAQAMARVSHPNVVSVYDVGVVDGQVFVAMERVEGKTLTAWLKERARPWHEVLRVFVDAARGLAAAHAVGLVHRDFKPDNVMVGNDGRVRVLDFGLARPANVDADEEADAPGPAPASSPELPRVTVTHGLVGTPMFMAPEQYTTATGVDHRVDQFALCVALYRAIYGEHPFLEGGVEKLREAVLQGRIRPAPRGLGVPSRIELALRRGMHPDRNQRFATMEALVAALAPPRRAWPARVAVLLGALLGAALVVFALRSRPVLTVAVARPLLPARQLTWRGDATLPAYSPDGKQLAFIGADGVHVLDPATSVDRLLSAGHFLNYLEWLPDGRSVLAEGQANELVQISIVDGSSKPMGRAWGAHRAILDGGRVLAYFNLSWKSFRVYKLGAPPETAVHCAMDVGQMWNGGIATSPADDRLVVAVKDDKQEISVWTVKPDCSDLRLLVEPMEKTRDLAGMRWVKVTNPRSGDAGEYVYLLVATYDASSTLVRVPVDASGRRRGASEVMATGIDAGDGLAVGPEGQLVYVHADHSSNLAWLVREPAAKRQLTSDTAQRSNATLSPDGQLVAFSERAGPRLHLRVLHLPDGRQRAAFELPGQAEVLGLAWSPSDDMLLVNQQAQGESSLWLYSLEGGAAQRLHKAHPSSDPDSSLVWSPDGRILYSTPGNTNFVWFALDGGEQDEVAREPYAGWLFAPVLTADGMLAAVYWNRSPGRGVYLMSTGTGESSLLLAAPSEGLLWPLRWSSDEAWLYLFDAMPTWRRGSTNLVQRVRPADGRVETWWKVQVDGMLADLALAPDGEAAVVTVTHDERDLWTVPAP